MGLLPQLTLLAVISHKKQLNATHILQLYIHILTNTHIAVYTRWVVIPGNLYFG